MAARRTSSASQALPFTKGQVNRAGQKMLVLSEQLRRDAADSGAGGALGIELVSRDEELEREWEALRWWRSLYARPLSTVAANLRYHVRQEGGRVNGRIDVTQRLKRLDTMIDKLAREEGRITQMHDIAEFARYYPVCATFSQ